MNHFFRFCVLFALAAVGASRASADLVLSTPSGLNTGDRFRFIFVTGSTTAATSSDITTYDTFVRNSVSSLYGNVTYGGSAITNWLAVGSTPTVSAKDHLGGYSSSVSVWLPNGTQVASSLDTATGGLWSGLLAHEIDQYLNGSTVPSSTSTWTGSEYTGDTYVRRELGASGTFAETGSTSFVLDAWMESERAPTTDSYAMYAVSPELTVQAAPSAVPEIDPNSLGSVLALVLGSLGLLERRRLKAA